MGDVTFSAPRPLEPSDAIDGFHSGADAIDSWLSQRAMRARRAGTAVAYVSFAEGRIAGFYSLSTQSLSRGSATGWLARNVPEQIPVVLLGMLGADERYQGMGLGADLLADAYRRAKAVSEIAGARALVVDPLDDRARSFYERWGFADIPGGKRMFAKLAR